MNQVALKQKPMGLDPARLSPNTLASAYASADPRFTAKKYDRAGLSRGAGQMNQAGIDAARNLANGIADAYTQQLQDMKYNASTGLQDQQVREEASQQLGALQQQRQYANQMSALQRQGSVMNLLTGLLR